MKRNVFLLILTIGLLTISTFAQNLRATAAEVKTEDGKFIGKLFITVNGEQKQIAEQVSEVWIINDGKEVVYSGQDGAGGYEGEGQSLHIYNVKTGKSRKIMSQYYLILGLSEVKLSNGKTALLVRMEDSGLGASYFSVVDPKRGEVFFESFAEITSLKNDTIRLLFYKHDDWATINEKRDVEFYQNIKAFPALRAKAKPYKSRAYDLKRLLKNKVIKRKHIMDILDGK